jgi:hypothetical protein
MRVLDSVSVSESLPPADEVAALPAPLPLVAETLAAAGGVMRFSIFTMDPGRGCTIV